MNAIFLPMFAMGLMGVNRRLYDAGMQYMLAQPTLAWQAHMTWSAVALGFFQIPFIANLAISARRDRADRQNPWDAKTLEWWPCGDCEPVVRHLHIPSAPTPALRRRGWGRGCSCRPKRCSSGRCSPAYVMLRAGAVGLAAPRRPAFPSSRPCCFSARVPCSVRRASGSWPSNALGPDLRRRDDPERLKMHRRRADAAPSAYLGLGCFCAHRRPRSARVRRRGGDRLARGTWLAMAETIANDGRHVSSDATLLVVCRSGVDRHRGRVLSGLI